MTSLARDPNGCWAIADRRTLVERDEGGRWHDVIEPDGPGLTAVLPLPGGALAGTVDARLVRVLEGKAAPVTGFDDVEGRDSWHAVPSGTPYVRTLTTTADARALLANVHVGGIPRSGNGGKTWKPTIDPESDVHQVRAHPVDPRLVLAAAAVGLCVSDDAGKTWSVTTDGLHATYCRGVAFTETGAVVSASDGPFTERAALYRWPSGGGLLERCRDGLPEWLAGNVDSGCIDATRDLTAFADDDAVWASRDGGITWERWADTGDNVHGGVAIIPD